MGIESVKNLSEIAAPFINAVISTFLVPKLKQMKNKWDKKDSLNDELVEEKFQQYMMELYENNSYINTIALKKRKTLLNDVFIPLTLINSELKKEIHINGYTNELFENSNMILITDVAGMGKSTILKKILISSIEQNIGIPILIELRRLSRKKGIIDEIIEQLNPINDEFNKQFILDLIKKGDFIFFLDGFDEIAISEKNFVTDNIQKFIRKARNNKFILASRPEDALVSFGSFQKFQIKPLTVKEAFQLLRLYDKNGSISSLLITKLNEKNIFNNIKEYLSTPLLVSLLYTAFEHKQKIPFKKHIFYRQVFDALFESHDLSKGESFEREKYTGLGSDEFHRILRVFGFLCLKAGNKIEFTRDELNKFLQDAVDFCRNINIKPADFIKDLLISVPIFTRDGIYYRWSHKSLQEYFAAQFIYLDTKERQKEILQHICFHYDNASYYNIIELYYSMDPIGFEQNITYKFLNDYLNYLNNTYINFSGKEKLLRQQYTFVFDIYLINFPFGRDKNNVSISNKFSEPKIDEFFNILRKNIKHFRPKLGVKLRIINLEENISYIKIPEIPTPYYTLLNFFFSQNAEFVDRNKQTFNDLDNKIKLNLRLTPKKVYPVTDRKNAFLNKGDNFNITNRLIELYLGDHFITINENKAKEVVERIQNSKNQKTLDKLLNF